MTLKLIHGSTKEEFEDKVNEIYEHGFYPLTRTFRIERSGFWILVANRTKRYLAKRK